MSVTLNRKRTYGGLAPGEADFTITLARGIPDTSLIVSIDGDGMEGFLKRFRRCLMRSTSDYHANICYLDDSNSNYYSDGSAADLTGNEGDVMVYFPEFWYKGESDSSSHKIHISTSQIPGYYHSPASLVGAYKATYTYSKLRSISDRIRTVAYSSFRFYMLSRDRGKGFHLIDYMQHRTIAWMFYTRYKNTNSQSICGTGPNQYSGIYNGTTDSLGISDTSASIANSSGSILVNFLGIEGCWGYICEFIEGIHSNSDDGAVIAYDKPDILNDSDSLCEYDKTYDYLRSTFNLPTLRKLNTSYRSKYISDLWGEDYGDMTIRSDNGSADRYFCDLGQVDPYNTRISYRSGTYDDLSGGVSYLVCGSGSGTYDSYTGSRLAFDGTIVETSVTDFKNITNWR